MNDSLRPSIRCHDELHTSARDVLASALREQVAREGVIEIEALGSSMEPTVPGGSVLRIEPVQSSPVVDELVAFVSHRGALLTCHRVVAIDERGQLLTQGDRHRVPDGFVRPDQVIGIARSFKLGGRAYSVAPHLPRPRPSLYRAQRQRFVRLLRRLRAQ
jgi:hypothetical protein